MTIIGKLLEWDYVLYAAECGNCSKANWVCDSQTMDVTKPDIDGFICWNCQKSNEFPYEFEGFEDESKNIVDGKENPGDFFQK